MKVVCRLGVGGTWNVARSPRIYPGTGDYTCLILQVLYEPSNSGLVCPNHSSPIAITFSLSEHNIQSVVSFFC